MKRKTAPRAAPGLFDQDFLLTTPQSCALYHDVAAELPIIDYHCHLPPRELAENRAFGNLTEIWLAGDHYKWRAMRANGVPEHRITGNASPREKFDAWAATVPMTVMNPLYHWTHLELKRPFGIRAWLHPGTAGSIWTKANQKLATPALSVHGILKGWKVSLIGTTDDPADDLRWHRRIRRDQSCPAAVVPTFRPDRGLAVDRPAVFTSYVKELGQAANTDIRTWDDFLRAHEQRIDDFHALGCRASDHALEAPPEAEPSDTLSAGVFQRAQKGKSISADEADRFRASLLLHLGRSYAKRGWTQQLHLGALRNVNTRMAARLGADAGCDTIGDRPMARGLARLLDRLDATDQLPRTILYNLNPADNELFAAMIGNFQDGSIAGKIQYGSGWWFLDQKDGMERQMKALAHLGLISRFVGMITDSRSFLSYSRHEYFRRIVCDLFGTAMAQGLIPNDREHIGMLVRQIAHDNAAGYFTFATGKDASRKSA